MKYSHAHNSTIMGDNRFKTIRNEPYYFSSPFIDSSKIKQLINLWLQHWKFPINSCLFVCLFVGICVNVFVREWFNPISSPFEIKFTTFNCYEEKNELKTKVSIEDIINRKSCSCKKESKNNETNIPFIDNKLTSKR